MKSIVDTAHSLGLKVAAHAHSARGIEAAARAGVDSIEHGTFADARAIAAMKASGSSLVPTLMAFTGIRERLGKGIFTPVVEAKVRETLSEVGKAARAARAAGVPVVFGTDAAVFEHGRNAQEFALLVELAGMSPAEAIASATTGAARLLGMEREDRPDRAGLFGRSDRRRAAIRCATCARSSMWIMSWCGERRSNEHERRAIPAPSTGCRSAPIVRDRLMKTPNAFKLPAQGLDIFVVRDFLTPRECARRHRPDRQGPGPLGPARAQRRSRVPDQRELQPEARGPRQPDGRGEDQPADRDRAHAMARPSRASATRSASSSSRTTISSTPTSPTGRSRSDRAASAPGPR